MNATMIEPLRKTYGRPAPAGGAVATIPDWVQQPLFLSERVAGARRAQRWRASIVRYIVRRFKTWIASTRVEAARCPISGAAHRIDKPIAMTGGQGRRWRVYGPCSLCGQVATVHRTTG